MDTTLANSIPDTILHTKVERYFLVGVLIGSKYGIMDGTIIPMTFYKFPTVLEIINNINKRRTKPTHLEINIASISEVSKIDYYGFLQ